MANTTKKSSNDSTPQKSFMQRLKEYQRQLRKTVEAYTSISQVETNDQFEMYVAMHPDAWMQLRLTSSEQITESDHRTEEAEQDD